jgi:hypothetical protein
MLFSLLTNSLLMFDFEYKQIETRTSEMDGFLFKKHQREQQFNLAVQKHFVVNCARI